MLAIKIGTWPYLAPYASPALPDGDILELAQIEQRIAAHFGEPQDIEWAWRECRFIVLQSRPITSLYPLPEPQRMTHSISTLISMRFKGCPIHSRRLGWMRSDWHLAESSIRLV